MSNFNTTSKDQNSQDNNNIYPKPCNYGCNTQIYWNNSVNEYWEVFTQKKHICPNRSSQQQSKPTTQLTTTTPTATRPTYYNTKKSFVTQPKPKMSNSFELLTGSIDTIQKKYEILSDLVTEHGGKTHGSQSHIGPNNSTMSLIVYYEVPLGQRDEVKQKFNNLVRNHQTILQRT
jgi:hypothetical protein